MTCALTFCRYHERYMTTHEDAVPGTPSLSATPGIPTALLPVAVKVIVYGGNLYTETGFPLYRYVPLASMVKLKQTIPWASQWGEYIAAWISTYVPLPRTTSESPVVDKGMMYQDRTGANRDYQQAAYRGWPLYTCGYDSPGFTNEAQGTVPGLFEMVSVEEPWVLDSDPDTDPGLPQLPKLGYGP